MATPVPPRVTLPALDPVQAETMLFHAADFVFSLSADQQVLAAHAALEPDILTVAHWIGRPLHEVVSADSRGKIARLLANDAADAAADARWRHINFDAPDGGCIPLLVKFLGLDGQDRAMRLLIARDLRPMGQMQRQFQSMLHQIDAGPPAAPPPPRLGEAPGGLTARIGVQPLDLIIAEVARTLERICLREAMDRAGGDRTRAAALLGLSPDDLDRRLKDGDLH
jgi:hypothetical protein